MNKLDNFYQVLLNAMPMPVFVLDDDVRIRDLNKAAQDFFDLEKGAVLTQRGGEALHCLYSSQGCGQGSHCPDCVIRNSVKTCLTGQDTTRRRMRLDIEKSGSRCEIELLVTATPISFNDQVLTLLVLEDISEISMLKTLLPICMHCKKIRDDQQYWQQIEGYFHRSIGVDFSHGICPDCLVKLYPAKPK